MQDKRGLAGERGHAKPVGDRGLNSRAFAAMTGAAVRFCERKGESRLGLGLLRSARTRLKRHGRMGRNVARRAIEARSQASLVDHCRAPASLDELLISPAGAIDAYKFDPTWFLYGEQPFCRCRASGPRNQFGPPVADPVARLPGRSRMRQTNSPEDNSNQARCANGTIVITKIAGRPGRLPTHVSLDYVRDLADRYMRKKPLRSSERQQGYWEVNSVPHIRSASAGWADNAL